MNHRELRFSLRPLDFLDGQELSRVGAVELRKRPHHRLLVWNSDMLRDLFRSEQRMRLAGSSTLEPLVGRRSLLFANGDRHTCYRRIVGARLRGEPLASYCGLILDTARSAVEELRPGSTATLSDWAHHLILRIFSQIALGRVDESLVSAFASWVAGALGSRPRALSYRYVRPPAAVPSPWRTFLCRRGELATRIRRGVRDGSYPGLAAMLPADIDEDETVDQVFSLLFAGYETTATALTSALQWLDRDEPLRHNVQDELDASSADGSSAADLPLLNAVCLETLRISPPALIAGNRVLLDDAEVAGQPMSAGTRLTPCIYLAHRQPETYSSPHVFDPGRFLGRRPPAHAYLPFGGGRRRCLGADLAQLELRMVLAALLRRRVLTSAGDTPPRLRVHGQVLGFGTKTTMAIEARRGTSDS